ncbi:hypothetical protein [Burkholderia pseudomultivorans]|uniref:hypothetical protein n=1 Tax=Burkholderia pseudomultivorans TaxID=1207504 RepID=UPI000B005CF5|nr:hypothetical protein [Burkholderia pseudomultivorans]
MVAHSVGPPLAMYLLPLGLSKEMYAGTTSMFFTVGNASKAVPRLQLARPASGVWALMAICVGAIPAGVVAGWRLHAMLASAEFMRMQMRSIAIQDLLNIIEPHERRRPMTMLCESQPSS